MYTDRQSDGREESAFGQIRRAGFECANSCTDGANAGQSERLEGRPALSGDDGVRGSGLAASCETLLPVPSPECRSSPGNVGLECRVAGLAGRPGVWSSSRCHFESRHLGDVVGTGAHPFRTSQSTFKAARGRGRRAQNRRSRVERETRPLTQRRLRRAELALESSSLAWQERGES
ncbi:unnamed protein product [Protopolystoma xenopodis]|uniref:Uncharacterized protein n=1 Tax=Protopolystoma xenopodis TaxID=117903 RepID=A0A448XDW1_9PLAT|nr:unnamed protein product [Protopolystoma xenopodis]